MNRRILVPLILLALAPTHAAAQIQYSIVQQRTGAWLGFQYVPVPGAESVAVLQIAEDSPAERGGLMAGDTVLSVGEFAAREAFVDNLTTWLEVGDTVRLRVRRNGNERDVVLVAAERPRDYPLVYSITSDSLRLRMRSLVDSAFREIDSIRISPGLFGETKTLRLRGIYADSLAARGQFAYVNPPRLFGNRPDTSITFSARFPDNIVWSRSGVVEPFGFGITMWGQTAIAGAELTRLEDELGEYFGVESGVLVLRVHDDTPAARAGLRAGDVVLRAADHNTPTVDALRDAIQRSPRGTPVRLEVMRRMQRMNIDIGRD